MCDPRTLVLLFVLCGAGCAVDVPDTGTEPDAAVLATAPTTTLTASATSTATATRILPGTDTLPALAPDAASPKTDTTPTPTPDATLPASYQIPTTQTTCPAGYWRQVTYNTPDHIDYVECVKNMVCSGNECLVLTQPDTNGNFCQTCISCAFDVIPAAVYNVESDNGMVVTSCALFQEQGLCKTPAYGTFCARTCARCVPADAGATPSTTPPS
ncbi:MAG: hypothetical protein ACLP9L_19975 [Thermoguttaceae bacterium]